MSKTAYHEGVELQIDKEKIQINELYEKMKNFVS